MTNIKSGNVRSPFHRNYYGVGYLGDSKLFEYWDTITHRFTKEYNTWQGMLRRCYSKEYQNTPYKNVLVCDRWKNFHNFYQDIKKLPNYELWKNSGKFEFSIDKDVICEETNRWPKIYSPTTCIFMPREENTREAAIRNNKYGYIEKELGDDSYMKNIFMNATKNKYRYNYKGLITTEDLWVLSLEELDSIYKNLKKQQKESNEESLLTEVSKEDKVINEKIEIVKAIVADKLAAKERAKNAAKKKAENQRILEIMADKQDAALKEKSLEELQAMLSDEDEEEE